MNVCLIGARGVGKTRTARRLAILLRRPVVSTDILVSYECGGKSVAEIIRQKGGGLAAWRFFRRKEMEVVRKVSGLKDTIIDCGGGGVVDLDKNGVERYSPRKVRLLRKNAVIVWLKADPNKMAAKNAADPRRPALGRSEADVMRRRAPFYKRAAHIAVSVKDDTAKPLARRVLRKLRPFLEK